MSETKTKKAMISTKDMKSGGRVKPVIDPGNHTLKVNEITFDQTPYDKDAWNITLHVETEPDKGEFQGFLTDMKDENSPRYEGQVGRIRFNQYPYKDTVLPNSGREISRDTEVLKAMMYFSEVVNMRDELDMIEAETIEQFMDSCNELFTQKSSSPYFNACVAGREWENKDGYINFDLFLPRMSKDGIPLEKLDVESSRLLTFNREEHIKVLKEKSNTKVDSFEPGSSGDDFEL